VGWAGRALQISPADTRRPLCPSWVAMIPSADSPSLHRRIFPYVPAPLGCNKTPVGRSHLRRTLRQAPPKLAKVELRTHAQTRASCRVLWRAWSTAVVPLRVELVALDGEACHLLVANLDPLRLAPRVQHAVHDQPARRRGRGNQIHDGRMADERAASPILGDVAEQAMLDLVPL